MNTQSPTRTLTDYQQGYLELVESIFKAKPSSTEVATRVQQINLFIDK